MPVLFNEMMLFQLVQIGLVLLIFINHLFLKFSLLVLYLMYLLKRVLV